MFVDTRLGGVPRYFLNPPQDAGMRIPDEVRKCVVFLGRIDLRKNGSETAKWCGTGFFVAVPSDKNPTTKVVYIVTAKHVADHLSGRDFFMRLNTKDGTSIVVRINNVSWWYHPTDLTVDVALFSVAISNDNVDFMVIEPSLFAVEANLKPKNVKPGVGDEVFITGLFIRHHGSKKNVPIMRAGNIAVMPDKQELIKTKGSDIEAYLIESRSFGGLSGSPCFLHASPENTIGIQHLFLLGLVHGHWDLPDESQMDSVFLDADGTGKVNTGIAVVVPAEHILETINHPRLCVQRMETFAAVAADNETTPD